MRVLIPNAVIGTIWTHVRGRGQRNEQGGILLGYRKPGALQVDSVTFPGRWDHASATLFRRSERGHRVRALREWLKSGRTIDWIGEWHTHPGGMARPSRVDRTSWARLARHTSRPMTFLIFNDTQVYVGLQLPHSGRLVHLHSSQAGTAATLFE